MFFPIIAYYNYLADCYVSSCLLLSPTSLCGVLVFWTPSTPPPPPLAARASATINHHELWTIQLSSFNPPSTYSYHIYLCQFFVTFLNQTYLYQLICLNLTFTNFIYSIWSLPSSSLPPPIASIRLIVSFCMAGATLCASWMRAVWQARHLVRHISIKLISSRLTAIHWPLSNLPPSTSDKPTSLKHIFYTSFHQPYLYQTYFFQHCCKLFFEKKSSLTLSTRSPSNY